MSKIFINYRREDSAPYAGRLYDLLAAHFGEGQVFIDIDNIDLGDDFAEVVARKVGACNVLIAVIGKSWATASDAGSRRRLDLEDDWVRMEITHALDCGIRVIPVLVGGAVMPEKRDLPGALAALTTRNALTLNDIGFRQDAGILIRAIERILEIGRPVAPQEPDGPRFPDPQARRSNEVGSPSPPPAAQKRVNVTTADRLDPDVPGRAPSTADGGATPAKRITGEPPAPAHAAPGVDQKGANSAGSALGRSWRSGALAGRGKLVSRVAFVLMGMLIGTFLPPPMPELFDPPHFVRSALAKSILFGMLPVVSVQWFAFRKEPALARAWIVVVPSVWSIGAMVGFANGGYFAGYAGGALAAGLAGIGLLLYFRSSRK